MPRDVDHHLTAKTVGNHARNSSGAGVLILIADTLCIHATADARTRGLQPQQQAHAAIERREVFGKTPLVT
jgi:hypothetical protein